MGRFDLVLGLLDSQNQELDIVVSNYILLGDHPDCKSMYTNETVWE